MSTPEPLSDTWRVWAHYVWAGAVVAILLLHVFWPQPGEEGPYQAWPMGLMPFPVAGALILARRPGNGVGRTLFVIGLGAFVIFFTWWLTFAIYDSPLSPVIEDLGNPGVFLSFGAIGVLLHLFPTGQPIGPRHRWVVRTLWAVIGVASLASLFYPGPLPLSGRENPLAVLPEGLLKGLELTAIPILLALVVSGIGVLAFRWRRAALVERLQLRWFLSASVVALGTFGVFISPLNAIVESTGSTNLLVEILSSLMIVLVMFWSIPIAITIAVLRYRLFEIDRLVSRAATYAIVVAVSVTVFAGAVVGIQAVLPAQNDLAVAASTLAVAALFNPLRKRVQHQLDRRFNRARYDSEQEVDGLARQLRDAHDMGEITREAIDVVTGTMQPATLGVWIRGS